MADVDCLFKPSGRSLGAGFSQASHFPVFLFILSRDKARSRLLILNGSSLLEELSEVLSFQETFWERIARAVEEKIR